MLLKFLCAFAVGGAFCTLGQLLLDRTSLTPARILVIYVVSGVILTALGLYAPLVKIADCGATVPLTGFGYALAEGVRTAVAEKGFAGVLTGGLTATAGGIATAICSALIFGIFKK